MFSTVYLDVLRTDVLHVTPAFSILINHTDAIERPAFQAAVEIVPNASIRVPGCRLQVLDLGARLEPCWYLGHVAVLVSR